jgi:hypothetical protein
MKLSNCNDCREKWGVIRDLYKSLTELTTDIELRNTREEILKLLPVFNEKNDGNQIPTATS